MLQLAMHRERARIKKEAAIAAVKRLEMVKGVEGALDACGFGGPSSVCVGPGPGSGGSQPPVVRQSADKRPRKRQRAASDCMSDGEDEDEGDGEDEGEDDSEGEGEGEVKEDEGDVRRAGFHSLDPDMRVRFQLPRNYRPRVQGVGGSDGPKPAVFDSPVPQAVPPSVSSIQTEGKAQVSSNAMLYHALHIIFGCCTVVTDDTGPSLSPPPPSQVHSLRDAFTSLGSAREVVDKLCKVMRWESKGSSTTGLLHVLGHSLHALAYLREQLRSMQPRQAQVINAVVAAFGMSTSVSDAGDGGTSWERRTLSSAEADVVAAARALRSVP